MNDVPRVIDVQTDYSADSFPCGTLVTNQARKILYANAYFSEALHWDIDQLVGNIADNLFTLSSKLFYESYLIPTLLHENQVEEMQLIIFNGKEERIPVTVNARLDQKGLIYWSFFNASKRDKLYEELIKAREQLQAQTQKLTLLATIDELTGLLNRREIKHIAEIALEQTKRSKKQIAVLMMDIDYFKKINDAWGHQKGDRVLKELGVLLKQFGRQMDNIARFGGEEFLIIMPDSNKHEAQLFAQRLHELVATITIDDLAVTVSMGITLSDGEKTYEALCNEADTALYVAKNNGRNRTEFYLES
jgi:diguanylate cyclase (GGDEF)-like protein